MLLSVIVRLHVRVPMCGGFFPYNFTFIGQYACVSVMSHFACVRSLCGGGGGGGGGRGGGGVRCVCMGGELREG